jgi:segregation and condensation protein B
MDAKQLRNILEAGLLVAGKAMSLSQLENLFAHDNEKPDRKSIKEALEELKQDYDGRGIELVEIASGYRLQSNESVKDYVANLFQEKPPRYSRALLETLVLIAYRQPITRAEIEEVRGVAVSSNIIKTLQEREWVKVLGHKDVPGKPALLGTTKEFLDYFNLKKLDDLPSLAEIKDLDQFDELLIDGAANDSGVDVELGGDVDSEAPEARDAANSDSNVGDEDTDLPDAESASLSEIDLGGVQEEHEANESQHVADSDNDDEVSGEDNSTLSGPEEQLMQTLSNFAEEHQLEVDARDQMEANMLSNQGDNIEDEVNEESVADVSGPDSKSNADSDADDDLEDIDLADLSQHTEDLKTGDLPEPGDTLH